MERADVRRKIRGRAYGVKHRQIRRALVPSIVAGAGICARCGEPIEPGEAWDLGHDDIDRRLYSGPEHARCNRGAPNRNVTSRQW